MHVSDAFEGIRIDKLLGGDQGGVFITNHILTSPDLRSGSKIHGLLTSNDSII